MFPFPQPHASAGSDINEHAALDISSTLIVPVCLQFPRVLMSSQVDSVSLPTPDWTAAAAQDYVAPSNGKPPLRISLFFPHICRQEMWRLLGNQFYLRH
jgi:hypothetical protein